VFFPFIFLSGIFVPIAGLPAPLRQIAEWNPLSAVATAVRELFHNPAPHASDAWPLTHPVAATVLYSVAIIAIVAPLAVRRYRRL
jgi:ABC-type polysaccharide/polyol phosphate export permease